MTNLRDPLAPFTKSIDVRFRHADPAGIMFFGNAFKFAHDTYEDFIRHLGFQWEDWFQNSEWAVPIRHSSCDHLAPLVPDQRYDVTVTVETIGKSSFTVIYRFEKGDRVYCSVSLVHTFFNKKTRSKMSIPSLVRDRLEAYRSENSPSK